MHEYSEKSCLTVALAVLFIVPLAAGGTSGGGLGAITAKADSGKLTIKGSPKGDGFKIDQLGLGAGQFRVTPDNFTLLNGGTSAVVLSGVTGDVVIDLGTGDDAFGINDAALPGRLKVSMASGDDAIAIDDVSVAKDILMFLDDGEDAVALRGFSTGQRVKLVCGPNEDAIAIQAGTGAFATNSIGGDLVVDGGLGELDLDVTATDVFSDLVVIGGEKGDFVSIAATSVGSNTKLLLKTGSNGVELDDSTLTGSLLVTGAAAQADFFDLTSTTIGGAAEFFLEGGENTLDLSDCTIAAGLFYNQGAPGKNGDAIDLFDVQVSGPTRFELGKGNNQLHAFTNCTFDSFTVRAKGGQDDVVVDTAALAATVDIRVSGGDNSINLANSTLQSNLKVKTGAGDDVLDLTGASIAGTTDIDLGAGSNTQVP